MTITRSGARFGPDADVGPPDIINFNGNQDVTFASDVHVLNILHSGSPTGSGPGAAAHDIAGLRQLPAAQLDDTGSRDDTLQPLVGMQMPASQQGGPARLAVSHHLDNATLHPPVGMQMPASQQGGLAQQPLVQTYIHTTTSAPLLPPLVPLRVQYQQPDAPARPRASSVMSNSSTRSARQRAALQLNLRMEQQQLRMEQQQLRIIAAEAELARAEAEADDTSSLEDMFFTPEPEVRGADTTTPGFHFQPTASMHDTTPRVSMPDVSTPVQHMHAGQVNAPVPLHTAPQRLQAGVSDAATPAQHMPVGQVPGYLSHNPIPCRPPVGASDATRRDAHDSQQHIPAARQMPAEQQGCGVPHGQPPSADSASFVSPIHQQYRPSDDGRPLQMGPTRPMGSHLSQPSVGPAESELVSFMRFSQQQMAQLVNAIADRPVVVHAGGAPATPQTVVTINDPPRSVATNPTELRQDFKTLLRYAEKNKHLSPTQAGYAAIFLEMPQLFGKQATYRQLMETHLRNIQERCDEDGSTPGRAELMELWDRFIAQVDVICQADTMKTWHGLRMAEGQTPQQFAESITRMLPSVKDHTPVDPASLITKFSLGIGPKHDKIQAELERYTFTAGPKTLQDVAAIAQNVFNVVQTKQVQVISLQAQLDALRGITPKAAMDDSATTPADSAAKSERSKRGDKFCERHGHGSHSTAECQALQKELASQPPASAPPPAAPATWGHGAQWTPHHQNHDGFGGHAYITSAPHAGQPARRPRQPLPPCIYCGADRHPSHQCFLVRPDMVATYRAGWKPPRAAPEQHHAIFREHLAHWQQTGRLMEGILPPGEHAYPPPHREELHQEQRPLALEPPPQQPAHPPPAGPPRAAMAVQGPPNQGGGIVAAAAGPSAASAHDVRATTVERQPPMVAASSLQPSLLVRHVYGWDDDNEDDEDEAADEPADTQSALAVTEFLRDEDFELCGDVDGVLTYTRAELAVMKTMVSPQAPRQMPATALGGDSVAMASCLSMRTDEDGSVHVLSDTPVPPVHQIIGGSHSIMELVQSPHPVITMRHDNMPCHAADLAPRLVKIDSCADVTMVNSRFAREHNIRVTPGVHAVQGIGPKTAKGCAVIPAGTCQFTLCKDTAGEVTFSSVMFVTEDDTDMFDILFGIPIWSKLGLVPDIWLQRAFYRTSPAASAPRHSVPISTIKKRGAPSAIIGHSALSRAALTLSLVPAEDTSPCASLPDGPTQVGALIAQWEGLRTTVASRLPSASMAASPGEVWKPPSWMDLLLPPSLRHTSDHGPRGPDEPAPLRAHGPRTPVSAAAADAVLALSDAAALTGLPFCVDASVAGAAADAIRTLPHSVALAMLPSCVDTSVVAVAAADAVLALPASVALAMLPSCVDASVVAAAATPVPSDPLGLAASPAASLPEDASPIACSPASHSHSRCAAGTAWHCLSAVSVLLCMLFCNMAWHPPCHPALTTCPSPARARQWVSMQCTAAGIRLPEGTPAPLASVVASPADFLLADADCDLDSTLATAAVEQHPSPSDIADISSAATQRILQPLDMPWPPGLPMPIVIDTPSHAHLDPAAPAAPPPRPRQGRPPAHLALALLPLLLPPSACAVTGPSRPSAPSTEDVPTATALFLAAARPCDTAPASCAPAIASCAPATASCAPATASCAPATASSAPATASCAPAIASSAPAIASSAPATASCAHTTASSVRATAPASLAPVPDAPAISSISPATHLATPPERWGPPARPHGGSSSTGGERASCCSTSSSLQQPHAGTGPPSHSSPHTSQRVTLVMQPSPRGWRPRRHCSRVSLLACLPPVAHVPGPAFSSPASEPHFTHTCAPPPWSQACVGG